MKSGENGCKGIKICDFAAIIQRNELKAGFFSRRKRLLYIDSLDIYELLQSVFG